MDFLEGGPHHEINSPQSKNKTEQILRENKLLDQLELHVGAHKNQVQLINIESDGKAIFKPVSGEQITTGRENTKPGTYYKREHASYLVDSALGFNLIPPTVIREHQEQPGSLQQFIEDAMPRVLYQGELPQDELDKMRLLDYILWNTDRNHANYLISDDGTKVHAIDNGLSFAPENKDLVISFGIMSKVRISPTIASLLNDFSTNLSKRESLTQALLPLIGETETQACLARIENLSHIAPKGEFNPADIRELNYHPQLSTSVASI